MKKITFYLAAVWLILLPWHAFLKTWLSSLFLGSTADYLPVASNIFSLWKEALALVLLLFALYTFHTKIPQISYKKSPLYLLVGYVASVLIFGGMQTSSLTSFVLAVRTDLLFVPILIVGTLIGIGFSKTQIDYLAKATFISLTLAFGVFMLAWLFAPDIGLHFGYSPYQSSYVEHKPLPIYHCLFTHDTCIPRLQASFSGPNQAGSMAILWGGLLVYLFNTSWLLIFPFLALFLTFSRSALLGGMIASFVSLPRKRLIIGGGAGVIFVLSTLVIAPDIITHGLSSSEHWTKTIDGINRIIEAPLGTGLGSAGPVSRRILGEKEALISENWYLQIGEEAGIISLLLLIAFTLHLVWGLIKSQHKLARIMGLVLLGTSFQALFLHLWEDSVVTILIWFWIGISLCYNSNESLKNYGK